MFQMGNNKGEPTFIPPADTPVTDAEQVELLSMAAADVGAEFWQDLIHTYETEVAPRFCEVRSAAQEKDALGMRRIIHFVAGSSANMGLLRMAVLCRNIEREIDQGTFREFDAVMPLLQKEYEEALAEVRKLAKAA